MDFVWILGGIVLLIYVGYKLVMWANQADPDSTYVPRPRRRRHGATVPKQDVLWAIRQAGANGIGRSGIIEALNIKGDTTAENSVTYQLAGLRKRRVVRHENRKYYVPFPNTKKRRRARG